MNIANVAGSSPVPLLLTPAPVPVGEAIPSLGDIEAQLADQAAIPVGGRLKRFWRKWAALGAPKHIVRLLRRGYALPFKKQIADLPPLRVVHDCPQGLRSGYLTDQVKQAVLDQKIAELLVKNAIVPMPEDEPGFFSRVFLVDKKDGGYRLILDVSTLNQYLSCGHFSMDTAQVIRDSIDGVSWATSIDFSDAYHHIPICPAHYRYLCFQIGGRRFWYIALPFGPSPAPKLFTDVMAPVKAWARHRSLVLFQYLDDWLNLAETRQLARARTLLFVAKCVELGLMVNLKKSELEPKQVIDFLGFTWNFQTRMIAPTPGAAKSIQSSLALVKQTPRPGLAAVESLVGKFVSVEKAVPWGRLNFRHTQRCFLIALRQFGRSSAAVVQMTPAASQELQWWSRPGVFLQGCPLTRVAPHFTLQTDASTQGWGIVWQGEMWGGVWSSVDRSRHINVLELRVISLACLKFRARFRGRHVHFKIDNITAVAYINKQGGTHSLMMMEEARSLFRILQRFQIQVSASHIAGELNVLADLASRQGQVLQTEWRLCPGVFQWIILHSPWGPPLVDMFANTSNRQLNAYVSPCPDPKALAVDALTCNWPSVTLYAFPPTTLLQRVVQKLITVRGRRVLLVAPDLPSAPWYPSLSRLAVRNPLRLPTPPDMLSQPHWDYQHPLPERLLLSLWLILTDGPDE